MSISDLKAVKSDPKMPECADVVVVGAGIVGVSTAYNLARRGLRVALLDKGRVGAEQSSRNWGWCRQQNRDEREIPLIIKSLALWEGMATEIGADAGFCKSGLSFVTDNEADLALWDGWNRMASQYGVPSRTLSAREA
ncbi:MAG: FAD-binding oxidoreductase, partial [Burkholderiaceae bacterium]|nr:FAD-binding oxidoreductase [Burkholderiaceae bacterium]